MNCCDDFGQCSQGQNCAARKAGTRASNVNTNEPDWKFPTESKPSPHQEMASDIFYFMGFFLLMVAVWAFVFAAWAVFQHFYPSTACMLQYLFSAACK